MTEGIVFLRLAGTQVDAQEVGVSEPSTKRHATDEHGDCAHWCAACRENEDRGLHPDGEIKTVSMTDLQIAIARVKAASIEMEAAIADLRRAGMADLTLGERRDRERAHNWARRSVA